MLRSRASLLTRLLATLPILSSSACGGTVGSATQGNEPNAAAQPVGPPLCLSSSVPAVLASIGNGWQFVVSGGYVYWGDAGPPGASNTASVMRVPVSGGTVEQTATITNTYAGQEIGVAATAQFIIVVTYNTDGELFLVPPSGGTPRQIGGFISIQSDWVASNETAIFAGTDRNGGAVTVVPLDGSSIYDLVQNVGFEYPFVGAVDGEHVFASTTSQGLLEVTLTGQVTNLGLRGWPLAIDSDTLFFATGTDVRRVPKSGGTATVVGPAPDITWIVADEASVYWSDQQIGLLKAAKDGGAPQTLRTAGAFDVGLDDNCLYWIEGGNIWTAPK